MLESILYISFVLTDHQGKGVQMRRHLGTGQTLIYPLAPHKTLSQKRWLQAPQGRETEREGHRHVGEQQG